MINRNVLLSDLQSVLRQLETDLIQRSTSPDVPEVGAWLQAEFAKATTAKRTAQNYTDWLNDYATQVAAAWVLSCVFARFLEDNGLYETPMIAGPVTSPLALGDGQGQGNLQRAKDERELYFRQHPGLTDRDYLLHVFQALRDLKGGVVKEVFGGHNPVNELPNWLGPDAAGVLLRFFQQIDPDTGDIRHDFTDPNWDTRFLGDIYQDLSEAARKKYALLQTPEFVEEFILDRTLDPALDEFTLTPSPPSGGEGRGEGAAVQSRFKMIDPACGSGHFLLGSFPRILNRWQRQDPGTNVRELVQRTLDSLHGVDINPFAIAIARFRLLLAAMRACGVTRLIDAPAFRLNLVCGDSLLHVPLKSGGSKFTKGQREFSQMLDGESDNSKESPESLHSYMSEDLPALKRILKPNQYHAVVANPPYIVPKDRALNEQYRNRFESCHMKYSLAAPFMEQLFRLADRGGYTGQITANSFMKREFGRKLIESFFPTIDLTHVIDTSGAYIPGHGTPTVILFGRTRPPVADTIRAVMGIRGEPSTPDDPSRGLVWSAIVAQIDDPGSQSEFVSVRDSQREQFHKHPWSIGGGGASELKEQLEENAAEALDAECSSIGFASFTGQDDAFISSFAGLKRCHIDDFYIKEFVIGDTVRDWEVTTNEFAFVPYDFRFEPIAFEANAPWAQWLWPMRTTIGSVISFAGRTRLECGDQWWTWYRWVPEKYRTQLSIVFGEIATHNHFILDRGGKVFNRTAPVIKLPREASEDDHLALLGLINSAAVCFWMKQVAHQKQMMGGDGIRIESKAKVPYAFSGTQLGKLPIPEAWKDGLLRERLLNLTRCMDQLASRLPELTPERAIASSPGNAALIRHTWQRLQDERRKVRSQMVLLQEEIDFTIYAMWNLADRSLMSDTLDWPEVTLDAGDRPFDILRGKNEDDFPVPHGIPVNWPPDLQDLWQRRMDAITNSTELRLIEDPHYKRRWRGRQGLFNHTENKDELQSACVKWLTDRMESYFDFDGRMANRDPGAEVGGQGKSQQTNADPRALNPESWSTPPLAGIQLYSLAKLADVASKDLDFMQVAELYRDDPAFNVMALVEELVSAEAVPLLPILRYKDSGLRKREEWEKTWELQRREDAASDQLAVVSRQLEQATDPVEIRQLQELVEKLKTESAKLTTSIPVPPKYISADFLNANFWRLRGKLDVPKERWISFPGAEAEDGSLMICWAGYDHLQQAQAISAWYVEIRDQQGGHNDKRLIPLLAGLLELLPWIKQWHNSSDNEFHMSMADFFDGFIREESRQLPRPATEPTEPDGEDLFPDAATSITYGWSLPEIQAWKPSARKPAKRAAKKDAKKSAAPKKAAKKRGKKAEEEN